VADPKTLSIKQHLLTLLLNSLPLKTSPYPPSLSPSWEISRVCPFLISSSLWLLCNDLSFQRFFPSSDSVLPPPVRQKKIMMISSHQTLAAQPHYVEQPTPAPEYLLLPSDPIDIDPVDLVVCNVASPASSSSSSSSSSIDHRCRIQFADLPVEIHEAILDHLFGVRGSALASITPATSTASSWSRSLRHPRRKALSNLALVCSSWRPLVQERIYRHSQFPVLSFSHLS
jgi:hypothetical protein